MSTVAINLAGSVATLVWLYRRGGARNALLCVGVVLLLFAFGPLVNVLMGETIYSGIVEDKLDQASTGFLSALVALALADLVLPQRGSFTDDRPARRRYDLLPLVLVLSISYAVTVVATRGWLMIGLGKLERIALAGPLHYQYLLVETFVLALYFLARRTPSHHVLYWINAGCYLAYCLVTTERDFIFIGLALLIQWQLFSAGGRSRRLILFGLAGLALASALAAWREGLEVSVAQTLNQGSIPFVDTFLMDTVPASLPYRAGRTYLDAVVSVLPLPGLRSADELGLADWLVSLYAPGYDGGFGFSLTGEAYLNFGMVGIPVVFFLVGLGVRVVVNRCDRSDFSTYLAVLVLSGLFNALRGDSAQLLKTVCYGAVFFAVLHVVSTARNDSGPLGHPPGRGRPGDIGPPGP